MLNNLSHKLDDPAVQELIAYSVFPDPDKLGKVLDQYRSEQALTLYGYQEKDILVGIIGVRTNDSNELKIQHIAVGPENRLKGYGRGLILELIEHSKPISITAETDGESVDFYRSIGFTVFSLGELYPGVERYRCVYEVDTDLETD